MGKKQKLLEFINTIGWEVDQSQFDNAIRKAEKTINNLKPVVEKVGKQGKKAIKAVDEAVKNVGKSVGKVKPVVSKVKPVVKGIQTTVDTVRKSLVILQKVVNRVGTAVNRVRQQVSRLNLFVSAAMASFTALSLKAASDATEVQNKFDQTFGEMSETANTFAEEFASSLNKSDTQVKESMANFQAFTVGLGFGQGEATGMSQKLQELATDFGSFNNLSDGESQQRFISAMAGSSEVVDRFGINLKVANLDLKLQELGLAESTLKATEMQKAVARLSIIEDSLGRQGALGDANRTLGDFASTMRGVRALLVRVGEAFGEVIVPIANLIGKGLIILLKIVEAIPAPLKAIILLLGVFITIATNAAVAVLFFAGGLLTLNSLLLTAGINLSTMTGIQIANIAISKAQAFATFAVGIATKLYSAAMGEAGIVTIISSVVMNLATIASGLLSGGMLTLGTSVAVATGGLSLIIPLIVGLIVGVVAAVKAIRSGSIETSKFGEIFVAFGKILKVFFQIWLFIPKLLFNVFDALSDILLTFLAPIFSMLARLMDPIFVAIDFIEKKFGSFENFLFEVMVRMLIPLAEFEIAVGEWSERSAQAFGKFFELMKESIADFVSSPMGEVLMNLLKFSPAAILGGKLFDLGSSIGEDFFQGGPQLATAGAPLSSGGGRSVNMNNEITNTIQISNGMSAEQAENVIVNANRRSIQQMQNDALRNTSGAD